MSRKSPVRNRSTTSSTSSRTSSATPTEWLDNESTLQELNGNLIVRSTGSNHRAIADLLAGLRETRAIQISVEARFLLVDNNFLEEVGFDLDFTINPGDPTDVISIDQNSADLAALPSTQLTPGRFSGPSGIGRALTATFGTTIIDDLAVDLLIRATQARQQAISLTAPRVTFFNGQRAYVVVARQISFISDLEPIPDAIGFDITLSVVQSGVVLDVEGTISSDRRYVTLTLRPSLATVAQPIRQIPVSTGAIIVDGGDEGGGVVIPPQNGFVEAPELELTEVRSTVSVPDRGTLLLGGQRLVGEIEVEAGVPVLSKIPVLNRLFTNSSKVKDERTLLILVKPTIIIQAETEGELYPGLLEDPQRYNVGQDFGS